MPERLELIETHRIFLDLANPRHEPYKGQSDVISFLCDHEQVLELATDVAIEGLNPLEVFAVIPADPKQKKKADANYIVAEGNRRLCALMLLNDPQLAPPKKRAAFEKLATNWSPVSPVPAMIFKDRAEVKPWLMRIHGGLQNGVGRRQWNPEQKARHTGDQKNTTAQRLLDYAQDMGYITEPERKGKITTIQRFVGNPTLREALGLEVSSGELKKTRPDADFNRLVKRFMDDVKLGNKGDVHSRQNAPEIASYARELSSMQGVSNQRIEPEPIAVTRHSPRKRRTKPKKPLHPTRINYNGDLHNQLKEIPSYKLETLYYSICDIDLQRHTPLLSIAVWAFIETLTAITGRHENSNFISYLNDQELQKLGVQKREDRKAMRSAIANLSQYGNSAKHHQSAALFNGLQLYSDVDVVEPMLVALAKKASDH